MDSVSLVSGPLHLVALILAISGAHKLLDPSGATSAMVAAGVPRALASGRVVGVVEIGAGAGLLAFGGTLPTVILGGTYAAFALFLLLLRRRDSAAPCGCFGATEAPPGTTHLLLNVVSVAVCAAALFTTSPALTDVVAAAGAGALAGYGALLLAGAIGVFAGTTVLDDIRSTTELMKA